MVKSHVYTAVIAACISSSIVALGAVQSESGSQPADNALVRELLAEVRGLRNEISWLGNASIRSQLLTARLQSQEQRIYTTARQLADAENAVATIRERIADTERKVAHMEEGEQHATPEEARQVRDWLTAHRPMLKELKQREVQLHAQQLENLNTLTTEQSRWVEFNNRLDELEQSLSKRTPR